MKLTSLLFTVFVFASLNICAQNIDAADEDIDTASVNEESIDVYDKFNSILGGDSIRWKEAGVKYTGNYEEYYPNGLLKHKGFYSNGQLTTIYKNYFDNGQMERSFRVIDTRYCQMDQYYKSGLQKSMVKYYKGKALIEEDYYPNGKMEYYEKYDKSFEYYITMKYFYKNGNPQSTLELTDKKNKMYNGREYWPNGTVKEEGKLYYNKVLNDYIKNGTWTLYDNAGNKIAEEDYVKGQLNDERKY